MSDIMPAGRYYIGDLCYVIRGENWDEAVNKMFEGNNPDGIFTMENGVTFASFGTAWGDGVYEDEDGHRYSVDAGLIGCVLVEDADVTEGEIAEDALGHVFDFPEPFEVYEEEGVIVIGEHRIDTDPTYDDDYEYDY